VQTLQLQDPLVLQVLPDQRVQLELKVLKGIRALLVLKAFKVFKEILEFQAQQAPLVFKEILVQQEPREPIQQLQVLLVLQAQRVQMAVHLLIINTLLKQMYKLAHLLVAVFIGTMQLKHLQHNLYLVI
jgi:hypothetical protein